MKKVLFTCFLMFTSFLFAQKSNLNNNEDNTAGDSLQYVTLPTITVYKKKYHFDDDYSVKYFLWLKKKVLKVYPYAVAAQNKVKTVDEKMQNVNSKYQKRKIVNAEHHYLKDKYESVIKKMTRTEGRVLIKLIHRQTGKTLYHHLKEKKGWFSTTFYTLTAKMYDIELDAYYNPFLYDEDYVVETIIREAIEQGELNDDGDALGLSAKKLPKKTIHFEKK